MRSSAPLRTVVVLSLVAGASAARAQDAPTPVPGAPPQRAAPAPSQPAAPAPSQPGGPQPVTPQGPGAGPPMLEPAPTALEEATRCFGQEFPRVRFGTGRVRWRLGAYGAFDAGFYDSDNARHNDVGATDFRPTIEAESGPFSFRIEGDAVGVDTPRNLYEAWAAWKLAPALRISAGQFRVALGSEFATWERDVAFIGYAFPAQLDGRHDVGARIDGTLADGLWYQAAWVSGHGFDLEGHRLNSAQTSLRFVTHPARLLHARDDSLLRGLHVGLAYAMLDDFDDPVIVSTPLQSRIFDTEDLDARAGDWLHIDVGWTAGPFQLGYEQVIGTASDVAVGGGDRDDFDDLRAFSYAAAYNLTGEPRGWRDGAFVPKTGPRPSGGLFSFLPEGRWEVGARYSNGDIDRKFFEHGIATYDVSSQETRTFSAALFWEPCETFRVGLEWVKTIADDAAAVLGDEKRDSSVVLRLEIRF